MDYNSAQPYKKALIGIFNTLKFEFCPEHYLTTINSINLKLCRKNIRSRSAVHKNHDPPFPKSRVIVCCLFLHLELCSVQNMNILKGINLKPCICRQILQSRSAEHKGQFSQILKSA